MPAQVGIDCFHSVRFKMMTETKMHAGGVGNKKKQILSTFSPIGLVVASLNQFQDTVVSHGSLFAVETLHDVLQMV